MKENSIEEDIKEIKKYISFTSKRENFSHDTDWNWNKDLANKIEHILEDYKRVSKENESLQKVYDDCYCKYKRYKQFESISVQKIKKGRYETEQKKKKKIKE